MRSLCRGGNRRRPVPGSEYSGDGAVAQGVQVPAADRRLLGEVWGVIGIDQPRADEVDALHSRKVIENPPEPVIGGFEAAEEGCPGRGFGIGHGADRIERCDHSSSSERWVAPSPRSVGLPGWSSIRPPGTWSMATCASSLPWLDRKRRCRSPMSSYPAHRPSVGAVVRGTLRRPRGSRQAWIPIVVPLTAVPIPPRTRTRRCGGRSSTARIRSTRELGAA